MSETIELDDVNDDRIQCPRCLQLFAPDELALYDGMMLDERCEAERREWDKQRREAEVRELAADYAIEERRDRGLDKLK